MNDKEIMLNILSVLFITLIIIFTVFAAVGCSFVTITTHQSTRLVDAQDGEVSLSRGHDVDTHLEKDNIKLKIPLLK